MTAPVALITGAGRSLGLGFETARQLAAGGAQVILTARDPAAAAARAGELAAQGLVVTGLALDVTDAASIAALAEALAATPGRLDILVNNAATTGPFGEKAADADLDSARSVVESILFGSWGVTKALLPLLAQSPAPRIVNVSSGAGSHADLAFGLHRDSAVIGASYGIAKAALNALTVKLAMEHPAMRINAVCPGFTATFEGGEAMGARPVADGAAGIVWAARLPDDGPTAGFFRDGEPVGW